MKLIRTLGLGLLLLSLSTQAGCWNRRELNELAITVGMAIDMTEEGQYAVTVQVVDPSEVASRKGGGSRIPVVTYESKGPSVFEALRKMTTISTRKIYMAHLRILVLGEKVAQRGITESMDLIARDHEIRSDFYVVLATGVKASDTLQILTPLEKIPAQKMFRSLEVSQQAWAPTYAVRLNELLASLNSEGKDPILTGVIVTGDPEKGKKKDNIEQSTSPADLKYVQLAVLREDKLVGWLNEEESKGYNYIVGKVTNTVGHVACPEGKEGKVVVEIQRVNSKVTAHAGSEGPTIDVEVKLEMNVGEVQCPMELTSQESLKQLERKVNERVEGLLEAALVKAQSYKADIFGFGETIRQTYPKEWEKMKSDWRSHFAKLPVDYRVESKTRGTGTINDPNKVPEGGGS